MKVPQYILLSAASLAVAAPGLALATSFFHDHGEGFDMHPEHVQSITTRADVLNELEIARKNGSLLLLQRSISLAQQTGPGKTRAQVQQELLSLQAQGKQGVQELYGLDG